MTWNTAVERQTILLSSAGEDGYNPILEGLPIRLQVEFSETVYNVAAYVGSTNPPTAQVTMSVDPSNTRKYYYDGVAGIAPFNTVDAFSYVRLVFSSSASGDQSVWDKKLYIASLPTDAVQVYSIENGWTSVNYATMPGVIPICSQMCPIRFFNSWYDEFRKKHFGGTRYVSLFDYGTSEGDSDQQEVIRQEDERIEQVYYVYLAKHQVDTVENHEFTAKFKTETGVVQSGVSMRVKVQSPDCWGFEIKDPVTT